MKRSLGSIKDDSYGRNSTVTHPSGIVESFGYTNGYLSSVSAGDSTRWSVGSINARQQVTSGNFANNLNATYEYDNFGFPTFTSVGTIKNDSCKFDPVTGNMMRRRNNKHTGLIEVFQYDDLDRLTNVFKNDTLTMSYNETGGLASKSNTGTYNYDEKPYSVSSIDPAVGVVPADTADIQNLDYTSFGSVNSITEKNYEADFIYHENSRARMVVKQDGNTILTRWYTDGGYIKENSGSTTKEYTFIGGDAYTAPVVAIKQNGVTKYYSLLRDNLGSITHIVKSSTNTVVAEYSYDAWGNMRDPATWVNYSKGSEPVLFVAGRGYTGHEHMPWFNLINMNGRLYDPAIAMFLNPDNYVQDPESSQNYNRYTYCLNNPLKYSDPSGMLVKARDESDAAFDAYFSWLCDANMSFSYMSGGGGYGLPGQGRNGTGLNGVYWDWSSFTYRSTSNYQEVNGPIFKSTDLDISLSCGAAGGFINSLNSDYSASSIQTAITSIQITTVKQLKTNWCAFAAAESIFSYFGINLNQTQLANLYYGKNNIPANSNIPANWGPYLTQFYYSNKYLYTGIGASTTPPSLDVIRNYLSMGNPVLSRVDFGQGGHAINIVGISTMNNTPCIIYANPDPNVGNLSFMTYSDFCTYQQQTVVIFGVNRNP